MREHLGGLLAASQGQSTLYIHTSLPPQHFYQRRGPANAESVLQLGLTHRI